MLDNYLDSKLHQSGLLQAIMVEKTIGNRCVELRKKLGLTQKAMAELVGVSLASWQNWEADKHKPMPIILKEIERLEVGNLNKSQSIEINSMADKCARLRSHYGYTRAQMAEFFGCTANSWGDWEAGRRKPNPEAKQKIEQLLAEKEVA